MKKLTSFIVIMTLLLSASVIANSEIPLNRTTDTKIHLAGSMLGSDIIFAVEDMKEVKETDNKVGFYDNENMDSNSQKHYYYDLKHTTAKKNEVKKSIFLNQIAVNKLLDDNNYTTTIMEFEISNNTRDGFLVGWFNSDDSGNTATNIAYALNPHGSEDGESPIPYSLNFTFTPDSESRNLIAQSGSLNAVTVGGSNFDDFVKIALAGSNGGFAPEDFVVILNGSGLNSTIIKETVGKLKVDIAFTNAKLLNFAGRYTTENKIAFIDL
jgi:hypothetical protein